MKQMMLIHTPSPVLDPRLLIHKVKVCRSFVLHGSPMPSLEPSTQQGLTSICELNVYYTLQYGSQISQHFHIHVCSIPLQSRLKIWILEQTTWVQSPAAPLTSWVTLGNVHKFSMPQCSCLENENNNSIQLLWALNVHWDEPYETAPGTQYVFFKCQQWLILIVAVFLLSYCQKQIIPNA